MITQEELRKLYEYDPKTGEFKHRQKRRGVSNVSKPVGVEDNGYIRFRVNGVLERAHRMAWLYNNGVLEPDMVVDHINHNKLDNRLSNLRLVSKSENSKNLSKPKNNTSGVAGVYKDRGRWRSKITVNGKNKYLGTYSNKEGAVKSRMEALERYKFYKNHGL